MPRLLRHPEVVWLSAMIATVMLSLATSTERSSMASQLIVGTVAIFGAFYGVRPRADGPRPVAALLRALGSSVLGSFLVFVWFAVTPQPADRARSADLLWVAVSIWVFQLAFAAHLTTLTRAGWRLAVDGWQTAVPRSPEVLWLAFTLLAVIGSSSGPELTGWSSVWLMAIAPMAVAFGCFALLLRSPAEQRSNAALLRTLFSCFLGLMATTLLMTQSPTIGAFFRTEGAAFVWAFVLFWQWAITAVCGLLAWAVVRGTISLRTAIGVLVGGAAAIVLGMTAWNQISIATRDPILSLSGEQRVRALSEAFGRARQQQPRSAWADGRESWNGFSVAFESPGDVVIRVTTDYPSALAARPPLAAGVTIPRTVAAPESAVDFWNSRKTEFAILRPFGITSVDWQASWEPPQPDEPPTLVWTFRREALQFASADFVDLCAQAELLHKGLLDLESGWGYWAELVEVWLADPATFERDLTRDLRRGQISLLQLAADCSRPADATCVNEVPGLLALAETARSLEAEGVPSADAIRARLTSPIYELSRKTGPFSAAHRLYLYNLYEVVESSGVFNHPNR